MAGPNRHVSVRQSIVMLLTILTATASAKHGLLHPKRADSCPRSSQKCSGAGLPDNFCCSSSSTCIDMDNGSSVICCPEGQDCTYIQPITCDVTKQDASLHPNNVIKTTRLNDDLPTCGNACCPFGYTCQGSFCAMDKTASSTSNSASSQVTTTSTSTSTSSSEPSESTESPTAPTAESAITTSKSSAELTTESSTQTSTKPSESATSTSVADGTDSPLPIADDLSTITVTDSSASGSPTTAASQFSAVDNNLSSSETSCPAFPTNAILAGFFPGTVFGAVAALLLTICIRRRQTNNIPAGEKVAQHTFRNSTGTLIGISDPIPSDESSFRTDFLLTKRHSEGSRSVLSRSRSRVRSLFSTTPKSNPEPAADIPDVPPVPALFGLPETPRPQRQRQPSSESIRIYTPPGVFVNPGPSPYPDPQRPNTTLTEILDKAQARMDAESATGSGANSKTNSTATAAATGAAGNSTQRFLLPPPQKLGGAKRKQLPY